MWTVGVVGGTRLTAGAWGGVGDGERGRLPSQGDEELVALSGKATAGDASGARRAARGSCPPTGPVLASGAPYSQSLREQMPGRLFPEGVGRGEAVDSLLTGTRWSMKCLCHTRAENRGCGWQVGARHIAELCPSPWALGR